MRVGDDWDLALRYIEVYYYSIRYIVIAICRQIV